MPRILHDPALVACPDFASPTYQAVRAPLVNPDVTEVQAIQFLRAIWTAGNEADKLTWQVQSEEDEVLRIDQLRIQMDAEALKAQTEIKEAEAFKKEEMKKNKSKYIPIPDSVTRRLKDKGENERRSIASDVRGGRCKAAPYISVCWHLV